MRSHALAQSCVHTALIDLVNVGAVLRMCYVGHSYNMVYRSKGGTHRYFNSAALNVERGLAGKPNKFTNHTAGGRPGIQVWSICHNSRMSPPGLGAYLHHCAGGGGVGQ